MTQSDASSPGSGPADAGEAEALRLIRAGRHAEAETLYRRLLEAGVVNARICTNLANLCQLSGRSAEQFELLDCALRLDPSHADAHNSLGIARRRQGDPAAACRCFEQALAWAPDHVEALNNLGECLLERGEDAAAIACLQRALQLRPGYADALSNLGMALARGGDPEAAIERLQEALACDPDHARAHNNLGVVLRDRGDAEGAERCFRRSLTLQPDHGPAHSNLGTVLLGRGDRAGAIACFQHCLSLDPDNPAAHNNLGIAQLEAGEPATALASFRRALAGRPGVADFLSNQAIALALLGDRSGALDCLRQALASDPEHHDSLHNLALSQLLEGDYRRGWQGYERRLRSPRGLAGLHALPDLPLWDGQPLRAGESLLLVSEQGLGDTLQFMRYLPTLREQGTELRFCAQEALHGLIRAAGIDREPLAPSQADTVGASHWLPLLSLPGRLEVGPERPLRTDPYLRCPAARRQSWQALLAGARRPLIGLHWQGNPAAETMSLRGRSLPLEALAPLAARSGGSLVSLQKGAGSEQLAGCSFRDRFVACQERIDASADFLDTAALISQCDLVISSDSAVAHLAAGMGCQTWLLLHHLPDWRWGLAGETSFWYPSMRLFRQRRAGDWAEVIERVAAELAGLEQLAALLGAAAATGAAP